MKKPIKIVVKENSLFDTIKFIIDCTIVHEPEKNIFQKKQMEIWENEFIKRIENFINQFSDK